MNIPTYKSSILQVKAHRILQARVSRVLYKFEVNPTEWTILGLISESSNGIRHAQIAKVLNVETPLITMLVNKLVEKELVDRKPHPIDQRAKLLFLTNRGRTLVPQVEAKLREQLSKLLHGISSQDLATYRNVLETIINNASPDE